MTIKLDYHSNLYLSAGIDTLKLDKMKDKLEKNPFLSGLFVIYISKNLSDQLDIIDAKMLIQRYYQNNAIHVVGLAESHEEAIEIVKRRVDDCIQTRGDCAIKEYLLCGV